MGGHRWRAHLFMSLVLGAGCAVDADRYDRSHVSSELEKRTGRKIGPGDGSLPPGVTLEDGIAEDEAVALALWNNSAFQEALTELGLRRADLVQAGMLPNPIFSILFPIGPKQMEMTLKFPFDALWLRPGRVAAAELDCERVSALLVQGGLDLVRDVRIAFSDLRLARSRSTLAREMSAVRDLLSEFMQARFRAGDISDLEAGAARVDALRARADATQALREEHSAIHRIRTLIAFAQDPHPVEFRLDAPEPPDAAQDVAALLTRAMAARPDLRGAELAIDAARERASLAEIDFLTLFAGADANAKGKKGFEIGPALEVPIPIFNQGQGAEARAVAELERAWRHQTALVDRIALEVRESHTAYAAAVEGRTAQRETLPILEEATRQAERAERAGDLSMLAVYESRLRLIDGRLRDADAQAEIRRASAQLERSVGGRLP